MAAILHNPDESFFLGFFAYCREEKGQWLGAGGFLMADPFEGLPKGHYGAIYADPPWHYEVWAEGSSRTASSKYNVMSTSDIADLPVGELAAKDCVLFIWATWPKLLECPEVIKAWGFTYKTCGFDWMKADNTQPNFFQEDVPAQVGMGYWTRANTEPCLLATRGKPKRLNADVRQGIIAPRREHSRKPDGVHERIERLIAGPYLELFARQRRPGWDCWGNEVDKFSSGYDGQDDMAKSIAEGFRVIRERVANGGPGWSPKSPDK